MEPTEVSPEVVCDAGPLIHLEEIGWLDLLADFSEVWVPEQVYREVERHQPSALTGEAARLKRVDVEILRSTTFRTLVKTFALDLGEQAALSLMASHLGAIFLTDDTAARFAARNLGYRVHGTIGVLLRAYRCGLRERDAVLDALRALPKTSTLHLRRDWLDEVIEGVVGS